MSKEIPSPLTPEVMASFPVKYRRKIRFSDTDAQSIVFNANYLVYFDDTVTDYFDALGIPWTEFNQRGYDMVLGRVEMNFRSSARVGDVVVTGAKVIKLGNTSVQIQLLIWSESTGDLIVEGKQVQVVVDPRDFKPIPIPDFFREAVDKLQTSS